MQNSVILQLFPDIRKICWILERRFFFTVPLNYRIKYIRNKSIIVKKSQSYQIFLDQRLSAKVEHLIRVIQTILITNANVSLKF